MRILILGATGRTGKLVVNEALVRGHEVVAVTRKPYRLTGHPSLTIINGSPDIIKSELLEAGYDAILSTLNISRTNDFPWASLITPKDFFIKTWDHILSKVSGERLIVVSAWGAGKTKEVIPIWFKWFIDNSNIRHPYQAHEEQEAYLQKTNHNWTFIRPVGLINRKNSKPVIATTDDSQKLKIIISRLDVAKFMLDVLENNLYVKQAVNISN